MSDWRAIPESVFVAHLQTTYSPQKRSLPEYRHARLLEISTAAVINGELEFGNYWHYPAGEIDRGIALLDSSPMPVVGFGLFNHSYRVLFREFDLAALVPRTIDVLDTALTLAYCAQPAKRRQGSLTLKALAVNNGLTWAGPIRTVARLWLTMLQLRAVNIGDETLKLDKSALARLSGRTPRFASVESWGRELATKGSTTPFPLARFAGRAEMLHSIYGKFRKIG